MTDAKITHHHINECNKRIEVVRHHDGQTYVLAPPAGKLTRLFFQGGPVGPDGSGINGITNEALIAVVIDRLVGFQRGPYACSENDEAILSLDRALLALKNRSLRVDTGGHDGPAAFAKTEPPPQLPSINTSPTTPLGALLKTTLDAAIDGTELPPDTTVTTQVNINKEPEEKLWPGQLAAKKGKK